jgi:carboxypeptidase family protein
MLGIRSVWRSMGRLAAPAVAALLLTAGPGTLGQATTATLVGTVTDTSGAAMNHATVTITNQNTGQSYVHQTNESGNYEFTLLPPGVYSVEVAEQGFANSVTRGVQATVNTTNRTDVQLSPGSASQTVTVTDQAPAPQTDRADVSAQIETKQVSDLPVGSSRNFQALESLVPGVTAWHRSSGAGRVAGERGVERRHRPAAVPDSERQQPERARQYAGAGPGEALACTEAHRCEQAVV